MSGAVHKKIEISQFSRIPRLKMGAVVRWFYRFFPRANSFLSEKSPRIKKTLNYAAEPMTRFSTAPNRPGCLSPFAVVSKMTILPAARERGGQSRALEAVARIR